MHSEGDRMDDDELQMDLAVQQLLIKFLWAEMKQRNPRYAADARGRLEALTSQGAFPGASAALQKWDDLLEP